MLTDLAGKKTSDLAAKERWVDDLLGKMTLEQKVGQLLVLGFCGPVITPDVVELITKYHLGGLRISQRWRDITIFNDVKPGSTPEDFILRSLHYPNGKNRDYCYNGHCPSCSAQEYASTLNKLREYSMERELGIPLHFTIDQEGNATDELLSGQRLFPCPMGLAATDDEDLVYRVALAIGKQARALGVNMMHSPVLDVNTNPKNPEIGARAYSDRADEVIRFARQSLKGFSEAGIIATGKHFPGRGESEHDAHWGLPSVNLDLDEFREEHLRPFKALVDEGLPAMMIAHCCYPQLGVVDEPSSCSKKIVTDLLRGELGFEGVITTDNMIMGGVLQKYEMSDAIVKTLIAGCDLVLCRDESPIRYKIIEKIIAAVNDGSYPESQLDASVARILKMRWDMGLAENGGLVDTAKAADPIDEPFVVDTCIEAAQKSTLLLRDEHVSLPLRKDQKILLVEQIFPTQEESNNMYSHPGLLWKMMCEESENVASVEIANMPGDIDKARVMRRLDEADIIVVTNYYYHKTAKAINDLIFEIQKAGKPVVVVSNTPYEIASPKEFPTVIVSFGPGGPENLKTVSDILFGKLKPTAKLPVDVESK